MKRVLPALLESEGVWATVDGGETWARFGEGAPARVGMRLFATDDELLLTTFGAGVERLPLDELR